MNLKQLIQKHRWLKHALTSFEALVVLAEINPLTSETTRLGVLFGVQAAFNNVALSAATFGLLTLVWELVGVYAVVDLINTKTGIRVIEKINILITKVGLGKLLNLRTDMITDIGITLFTGTPAFVILKHRQDPSRTPQIDRQTGYRMAVIVAFAAAAQGAALMAGIWHPNTFTIALAVLAILSLIVGHRLLIKRLPNLKKSV